MNKEESSQFYKKFRNDCEVRVSLNHFSIRDQTSFKAVVFMPRRVSNKND